MRSARRPRSSVAAIVDADRRPISSMPGSSADRRGRDTGAGDLRLRAGASARPRCCAIGGSIWRVIDGPIGAASALKMSYAGITKGNHRDRRRRCCSVRRASAVPEALIAELSESQPQMLARMRSNIPGMYDKAYRWVAEMEEISTFSKRTRRPRDIYAAVARLYDLPRRGPGRSPARARQRDPNPRSGPRQQLSAVAVPATSSLTRAVAFTFLAILSNLTYN